MMVWKKAVPLNGAAFDLEKTFYCFGEMIP